MPAFDVFISYSSTDKPTADATCATLEAAGVRCWIAPRDIAPGADWGAAIVEALDSCKVMVLIFSASANASPQIRNEIARAVDRGIPVIPVRIEDIVPTKSLAYFMTAVHWLDALTPPLESHLQKLARSIQAMLGMEQEAPRPGAAVAAAAAVPRPPAAKVAAAPIAETAHPNHEAGRGLSVWLVRALAVFGIGVLLAGGTLIYLRATNAAVCEEMWIERNSYYKLRGYCFKTPRAIAHFGNEGCTTDDPAEVYATGLSPLERDRVKSIRFWEWVYGCAV